MKKYDKMKESRQQINENEFLTYLNICLIRKKENGIAKHNEITIKF
jgi:hypothetical protein